MVLCEEIFRVIVYNPDFHFQQCVELRFQKCWGFAFLSTTMKCLKWKTLFLLSLCLFLFFMLQEAVNHPVCRFQSLVSPLHTLIWMANKSQCRVSARKCKPHWSIKMKIYPTFSILFLILRFPQLHEYDDTNWHLQSFLRFPSSKA